MKIQNNSNVSFKAHFRIEEQRDYSFSEKELKDALTKPANSNNGKDILDFLAYIYSDEGKAQLDKLPEEDTVELMLFENNRGKSKAFVDPYFYYKSPSMSTKQRLELEGEGYEGEPSSSADLKETFIRWTNQLVDFIEKSK